MCPINWSPEPPPEQWIPIVSVRRQQTLRVIAAGPTRGVKTHWVQGRSLPCCCPSPQEGICRQQRARWKGYMPCVYHNNRRVIVEVTLGAVRNVSELLRADVVGYWLKFSRPGPKENSAVFAEILVDMPKALNVVPFDPVPSLLAMWEMPVEGEVRPDQADEGEPL